MAISQWWCDIASMVSRPCSVLLYWLLTLSLCFHWSHHQLCNVLQKLWIPNDLSCISPQNASLFSSSVFFLGGRAVVSAFSSHSAVIQQPVMSNSTYLHTLSVRCPSHVRSLSGFVGSRLNACSRLFLCRLIQQQLSATCSCSWQLGSPQRGGKGFLPGADPDKYHTSW